MTRVPARTRSLLIVAVTVALVVACSCGKTDSSGAPAATEGTIAAPTTPPTTAPPPAYPLTGLPIDDPAKAARNALVVKMDNANDHARPQAGLNQADVVIEEKVEGPISRFFVIFHSQDAARVEPVRSARSTDIHLVGELNHPLFAFSGANAGIIQLVRAAPLVEVSQDGTHAEAFDRDPKRPAPYNVVTSTDRLWAFNPTPATPPNPLFTYRKADDPFPLSAVDVATFGYDFGLGPIGQPVNWTWDPARKGWAREQKGTPHVDQDGVQIAPPNVIVQLVPYIDTQWVDTSGTRVPEAKLVGTGEAWVFVGGKAVKTTWAKADDAAVTTYTVADGGAAKLDPGPTWVILVPEGGSFSGTKADGTPLG